MSDSHDLAHFQKHIKACIGVFVGLMVLTVITVVVSCVNLGHLNIPVALAIATFKALLVCAYFMHLNSEKKSIYRILTFTFIFFAGLMFLTLWASYDKIIY
jgi:cytochrome c oxidase subunit IV